MRAAAAALLSVPAALGAGAPASTVCVYNQGGYVLHWHLEDADSGAKSDETNSYPLGQTKCINADQLTGNVAVGHTLKPKVHAVWGHDWEADAEVVQYNQSALGSLTYICHGTTLSIHCEQGPAPPTAANVTKAMGLFLVGFVSKLGEDIGFKNCIADIKAAFDDIATIATNWQGGLKGHSADQIGEGFKALGKLLIDFGLAIKDCVAEATSVAAKFSALGAKVAADPWTLIEVVAKELFYIFSHTDDLTTACKSLPADWHTADWQSAGEDLGEIVGILIAGLEQLKMHGVNSVQELRQQLLQK